MNEDPSAPLCPACGKRVSRTSNQQGEEWQQLAWNSHWDGRCAECGREFEAAVRLKTGHTTFFAGSQIPPEFQADRDRVGQSILRIRGTESVYMACDSWEHVPAIEVRVKRAVAANVGLGEGLLQEAAVNLTLEEWNAVIEQLEGPLRVLFERRRWYRDTT